MPTIKELIENDKKNGISPDKTKAALDKLGLIEEDFDLDINVAKEKAKARKAESLSYYGAEADKALEKQGKRKPSKPSIKTPEEATDVIEKSFGFDVGTGTLESAFGMQGEKPFKSDYAVSAEKRKNKVVVPLAQEIAEAVVPEKYYKKLPDFAQPEDKASESDLRLEIGPSAEKLYELGKAAGKESLGLAASLLPKPLARDAQDFYGLPERPKTLEIADSFAADIRGRRDVQKEKSIATRVAEFPVTVTENAKEIAMGLIDLTNYYVGINMREGETRESEAKRKASETVASLTGIPVGLVQAVADDEVGFLDVVENRPVDFFLTVLPVLKSAGAGVPAARIGISEAKAGISAMKPKVATAMAKSPKLTSFGKIVYDSFSKVPADILKNTPTFIKDIPSQISRAPDYILENTPAPIKKIQSWTSDGFKTSEPAVSSFVEQAFKQGEEAGASVREAGARASRQLKDIETKPRSDVDVTQKTLEIENLDESIKALKEKQADVLSTLPDDFVDNLKNLFEKSEKQTDFTIGSFQELVNNKVKDITKLELPQSAKDITSIVREELQRDRLQTEVKDSLAAEFTPSGRITEKLQLVDNELVRSPELAEKVITETQPAYGPPREEFYAGEKIIEKEPNLQRLERQELQEGLLETFQPATETKALRLQTIKPEFDAALRDIANEVVSAFPKGQTAITPDKIYARFANVLDREAGNHLLLLKDKGLKNTVLAKIGKDLIEKQFTKQQVKEIIQKLDKRFFSPEALKNDVSNIKGFEITDRNGNILIDSESIRDIIYNNINDPKVLERAKKAVVLETIEDIANETEKQRLRQNIINEAERFLVDDKGNIQSTFEVNPELYAKRLVQQTLIDNKPKPAFIPFDGKIIADVMRENTSTLAKDIGVNPEVVYREAARYEQMRSKLDPKVISLIDNTPGSKIRELFTFDDVGSAVKWEVLSKDAVSNPMFGLGLFQSVKKNLTARSIPTLKNNNLSNYYALTLKTGNPLIGLDVFKTGFYDYILNRNNVPKEKQRIFNAIDTSNLVNTTELARDIGFQKAKQNPSRWNKATGALEQLYNKAGDVPFKVQQAYDAFNTVEKSLKQLNKGEYVQTPISKNTVIRFTKGDGESYSVQVLSKNGKPVAGTKTITDTFGKTDQPTKLDKAIAKAAAYEANTVLFDYSDVGKYAKVLRSYPVLNAMSGFYTWFLKSLDIPFFKRGMMANTFMPADFIKSNSPLVEKSRYLEKSLFDARRAAVANAARQYIINGYGDPEYRESIDLAKKIIGFSPRDSKTILLGAIGDPANLYYNDFTSTVPFKATDVLGKILSGGLNRLYDVATIEKDLFPLVPLDKEVSDEEWVLRDKERKQRELYLKDIKGETFTAKDVLSLVGFGGNALFTAIDTVADSQEQGKIVDWPRFINQFGQSAIGRTPWTLISAGAGGIGRAIGPGTKMTDPTVVERLGGFLADVDPYSKEEKRFGFYSGESAPESSSVIKYLVGQIIGSGWKKVNLFDKQDNLVTDTVAKSRYEYFLTGVKRELETTVIKPLEARAQRYLAMAENERDPTLKQKYEEQADFYINNVRLIKEEIQDILDQQDELINVLYSEDE